MGQPNTNALGNKFNHGPNEGTNSTHTLMCGPVGSSADWVEFRWAGLSVDQTAGRSGGQGEFYCIVMEL